MTSDATITETTVRATIVVRAAAAVPAVRVVTVRSAIVRMGVLRGESCIVKLSESVDGRDRNRGGVQRGCAPLRDRTHRSREAAA